MRSIQLCFWLVTISLSVHVVKPPYQVHGDHDVMVPMRDGVKLATDIYRPQAVAKSSPINSPSSSLAPPTKKIVINSQANTTLRTAMFLSPRTPDRYATEGIWHMITDDDPDGTDTAAWIAAQNWSTGHISMLCFQCTLLGLASQIFTSSKSTSLPLTVKPNKSLVGWPMPEDFR